MQERELGRRVSSSESAGFFLSCLLLGGLGCRLDVPGHARRSDSQTAVWETATDVTAAQLVMAPPQFTAYDGVQSIINYNFTAQTNLSTEFVFALSQPARAFGLWVWDWGTFGPPATEWVWSTDAGDNFVVASRPPASTDWVFIGLVNETSSFTNVTLSDPDGFGDGYLLDKVYTTAIPEPTSILTLGTGLAAVGVRRYRRQRASRGGLGQTE